MAIITNRAQADLFKSLQANITILWRAIKKRDTATAATAETAIAADVAAMEAGITP